MQASEISPSISNVTRRPDPGGITDPSKEKPITTLEELSIEKPASSAAPPYALIIITSFILNWKPDILTEL